VYVRDWAIPAGDSPEHSCLACPWHFCLFLRDNLNLGSLSAAASHDIFTHFWLNQGSTNARFSLLFLEAHMVHIFEKVIALN